MYKLRPYQREAVDKTIKYFTKKRDPAVLVLPTGAGKSLVIAELARMAKGRVLVLAHVKELVEQNHLKYESFDLKAGIYSAGLNQKDVSQKVIFGSIQSIANAEDSFFDDFNLVIIDECHRISLDQDSQYLTVIKKLKLNNPKLCILGLTATPYRMGVGWIYNISHEGIVRTKEERFFKDCIFELPLKYMIRNKYLTPPVKVDIPVTCYDFSDLELQENGRFNEAEISEALEKQGRLTPLIIKNIIEIAENQNRGGIMIFSGNVKHARDILKCLPENEAQIILGDTAIVERDKIINDFKERKFKYLVNVSVLTTGFDAPHVDAIAILRPTESVSLYQQIIGRGLRLSSGKKDCFVLDYTGMGHDIYAPEVGDKRPSKESEEVEVICPQCGFENTFWGTRDEDGELVEHFGRKCKGGVSDPNTFEFTACGFRFRFKRCGSCGAENDLTAKSCNSCNEVLVDPDAKLKKAKLSKGAHVMRPVSVEYAEKYDKRGNPFLEIRYYDVESNYLSEAYFFSNYSSQKKFEINFLRSHIKLSGMSLKIDSSSSAIDSKHLFRMPSFIIARKQDKFWRVTEKIFSEELSGINARTPDWMQ
ncbi:MAG: DEAD/DEAH box helicase [Bdellovibrionales bacterium]